MVIWSPVQSGQVEGRVGGRVQATREHSRVERLLAHRLRVRQHVADHESGRPQTVPKAQHRRQIGDVSLHHHKSDADLGCGPIRSGRARIPERREIGQDLWQGRAEAHVGVTFRCGAVQGDPEQIQPRRDQSPRHILGEKRPVGDELRRPAEGFRLRHHLHDARMRQRFAEAAKEYRGRRRKRAEPIRDPGEGRLIHLAERLVPPVPDAGATLQIAAIRRLDVDLRQAVPRLTLLRAVRPNNHVRLVTTAQIAARHYRRMEQPASLFVRRALQIRVERSWRHLGIGYTHRSRSQCGAPRRNRSHHRRRSGLTTPRLNVKRQLVAVRERRFGR